MNKSLNYKNILFIRPCENNWAVEYETYFNPHATPKQLMDTKTFNTFEDAFAWSNNYLHDNYLNEDDDFVFTVTDITHNT